LQIRVIPLNGAPDEEITLPANFTPTDPFMVTQTPGVPTPVPEDVNIRYLTLNETFDEQGRLIQLLGTDVADIANNFGKTYVSPATEVIKKGTTEVWEIVNLTGDTHPIHFHLVNVQVLSRQDFNDVGYQGGVPAYTGPALAPDDNELGWKETVRVNPAQVTRVLMKFDLADVPYPVPESPRTGGNEFVWHCHILEHEEHDMMRPLVVFNERVYLPLVFK
jgi:spore coat protein A